ncbi:transcription elongation regulator 1 isoform X2 [Drosophila obscura]|uniref:transcription elongation regulator 1 isoform X2 n=1 Tax=Drosophila obscura TaxID=7282 RepID=UPI001BB1CC60|nr:transcription elongation regulator 1 isoform X2 [Drosophila obscura]
METSLDESMDSERAISPVNFQEANQSPPGVALNINGNGSGSGTEGPNGVAIAATEKKPTEVTWSKPFNAFSGRPIGEHSAQQQTLQQQALQQQQQQQPPPTHHQQLPPPGANGVAAATPEIWVETKAEDGRSYYYHAVTRETTWTRPDGPTVKIMTQTEVEEMAKRPPNAAVKPELKTGEPSLGSEMAAVPHLTSQPPPHLMSQPPPNATGPLLSQPPPNVRQQPPPMFQPPGMQPPPGFGQPPFCMPPPAYGFPGGAAPGGPWGVGVPPWQQQQQQQQQQQHMHAPPGGQDKPAKTLIIKPGVIDPAVIARAAEWSEHRAPDGRPYYYHAARGESVWEKPQALRDMEAARMAAHSGVSPAVGPPGGIPPHLLPNPMMHMPPGTAPPGFDPQMAYAAAAAAMKANTESAKASQAAALEKEAKKAAEEKRKKEEEQKKQAAATAKQTDKSRPVTSTPIAGTPWCVVWTGDSRVFFYNPSTRTSVWDRPEDLMNREDVDKAVNDRPEQLKTEEEKSAEAAEQKTNEEAEEAAAALAEAQAQQPDVQHVEPEEEDDEEVIKIGTESESSVEEVPTKRVRMVTKSKRAEDAALEAEQRAAKERALIPLEMRVTQFKEMLREKDVSAFSTWEKELHKIVFDPRYLLLTSKERKQVFEKYVKDRAEEERKEKRNKMRQKRDDFRSLMEEARLHGKSSFSEFSQKNAKEERYRAIEKVRERESLFNEYIVEVRRREKEDKQLKKEQIRKDFLDMLRERHDIERHTRWYDIKKKLESDARYRIVDSMYREEYFEDYLHLMKEEKRKEREQREQRERERHRERKSDRKDKDKEKDKEKSRKDRGRSRSKDKDRELKSSKDKDKEKDKDKSKSEKSKKRDTPEEGEHHDESEREERAGSDDSEVARQRESEAEQKQKEREKKLRAEQSIREREKEVQRTLAGHLRDRDKEREHHKRDESIGHFTALLTDLVRTADFTWKEVKRQLRKDHRWELIEPLDRDDRERIFNVHIDNLMKKKRERFREMLDEIGTLQLTSTWKEIKKLVKEDPRYLKYNSEKGEREFRDYIKDKTMHAKTALRELLQECKFITHKSSDLIKENSNHLKEIQDILKNDKRYLVLDHLEDERNVIVVGFVEELNKRGPPPPPTASESTRRNK